MFKSLIKLFIALSVIAGVFAIGQFFTGSTAWNNSAWNALQKKEKEKDSLAQRVEVGRVVKRKGHAKASFDDAERKLNVGDPIFQEDRLITGLLSRLRIKMTDGAELTLGDETLFAIDRYPLVPKEKISARLIYEQMLIAPVYAASQVDQAEVAISVKRGIFSFISGSLPKWLRKNNQPPLAIQSPVATMGIRGTTLWSSVSNKEVPKNASAMRSLDVICMQPVCTVSKGAEEQVMGIANTGLAVDEGRQAIPAPTHVPGDKIVQAQVTTVIPKEMPPQMVTKIQEELVQSLLTTKVVATMEEARLVAQSSVESAVARSEFRVVAKALQEIQAGKGEITEREVQVLLEQEAQKLQSQEQYFKNVEDIMQLKNKQKTVNDQDKNTVEEMDFTQKQMNAASKEVVAAVTEQLAEVIKEGKSVAELVKDKEFLEKKLSEDKQLMAPAPTPTPLPPEKTEQVKEPPPPPPVDEEMRRLMEQERQSRINAEKLLLAMQQERDGLLSEKNKIENKLAEANVQKEWYQKLAEATQKLYDDAKVEIALLKDKILEQAKKIALLEDYIGEIEGGYNTISNFEAGMVVMEKVFSDPNWLARIEALQTDPHFKKALENPQLMKMLNEGRFTQLVLNEDFAQLKDSEVIKNLMDEVKVYEKKILAGEDPRSDLTPTGSTEAMDQFEEMLGIKE